MESFNFTQAAEENNDRDLVIIHDKKSLSLNTKSWRTVISNPRIIVEEGC